MSDYFFYDLNKKMADLANKQQLAENAQATPAKPAPNKLMEAAADYSAKKAAAGKDIGKVVAGVIGIAGLHQRRMDPLAHDEGGGGGRKHQRDSQRLPAQPHQIAQQLDVQRRHQLICAG